MDDGAVASAKAMIAEKDHGYFTAHGLAALLKDAGMESDPGTVRALVRRLIADDVYAFLAAASAGLRDSASDDDESARAVSAAARRMRHDAFQGPLVDALVEIGRGRPVPAAGLAARLIGLGDADFAAYLIGGAYGGARPSCDGMIERLASSGDPADAAAAIRSLRIAGAEHKEAGAEHKEAGAKRTGDAVRRAMVHGHPAVGQEAMEAMLDIHEGGDAESVAVIESMAADHPSCRPVLAGRIWSKPPFGDLQCLRLLETCVGGSPDQGTIHSAYRALAGIAGREPRGAAGLLFRLFAGSAYHSALAGPVLEELGRADAPGTALYIIEMLQDSRQAALDGVLGRTLRRLLRFADYEVVAGQVSLAMDEQPSALVACLSILGIMAIESHRNGRGREFAARVMPRLCGHAAGMGIEPYGVLGPCRDARLECASLICRMRELAAGGGPLRPARSLRRPALRSCMPRGPVPAPPRPTRGDFP